MWVRFLLRDLAVGAATAVGWWGDAWARAHAEGVLAIALAVVAAVLTALCGYLVHEWGHLTASWLSRSVVEAPARLTSPFLFRFDTVRNDRRQFLAMSAGGYLASVLALGVIVALVPWPALSATVTLVLTALGVLATFVLEVPVTWRVLRGQPLPGGGLYTGSH